jgi:hypothetical protein
MSLVTAGCLSADELFHCRLVVARGFARHANGEGVHSVAYKAFPLAESATHGCAALRTQHALNLIVLPLKLQARHADLDEHFHNRYGFTAISNGFQRIFDLENGQNPGLFAPGFPYLLPKCRVMPLLE